MPINTGVNVSRAVAYAVLSSPNLEVSKAVGYAVLADPCLSVGKVVAYAVLSSGVGLLADQQDQR